jgi:hypothetical protein
LNRYAVSFFDPKLLNKSALRSFGLNGQTSKNLPKGVGTSKIPNFKILSTRYNKWAYKTPGAKISAVRAIGNCIRELKIVFSRLLTPNYEKLDFCSQKGKRKRKQTKIEKIGKSVYHRNGNRDRSFCLLVSYQVDRTIYFEWCKIFVTSKLKIISSVSFSTKFLIERVPSCLIGVLGLWPEVGFKSGVHSRTPPALKRSQAQMY